VALQHPLDAKHDRGVESTLLSKNELRALALYFSDAVIGAGYSPYEGKVNPMLAAAALNVLAPASTATPSSGRWHEAVPLSRQPPTAARSAVNAWSLLRARGQARSRR